MRVTVKWPRAVGANTTQECREALLAAGFADINLGKDWSFTTPYFVGRRNFPTDVIRLKPSENYTMTYDGLESLEIKIHPPAIS